MYGRQRCSLKSESVIPYLDYAKCFWDGWFIISFIHNFQRKERQTIPQSSKSVEWHSLTSNYSFAYRTYVSLTFSPPPSNKAWNGFAFIADMWMNEITNQPSLESLLVEWRQKSLKLLV